MKDLTERKLVYLDDAINAVNSLCDDCDSGYCGDCRVNIYLGGGVRKVLEDLPSAQPEQRCVNCGRTVNNGGWYKDGRTRCPIEEHYALPKDGYCHLWEKTKVWEDDYVKRPEEGKKDG